MYLFYDVFRTVAGTRPMLRTLKRTPTHNAPGVQQPTVRMDDAHVLHDILVMRVANYANDVPLKAIARTQYSFSAHAGLRAYMPHELARYQARKCS